jgi:hypothetical protein
VPGSLLPDGSGDHVFKSGTWRAKNARSDWMLLYTPYFSGSAQPSPQLTMPTWVSTPPCVVMSGPPLSPWHASKPPSLSPAHCICGVTVRLVTVAPG